MALIKDLLARGRTYSFEFFPPKDDREQRLLTAAIGELEPLHPSFVSVTYRGGAASRARTTGVVGDLLKTTSLMPMASSSIRFFGRCWSTKRPIGSGSFNLPTAVTTMRRACRATAALTCTL